MERATRSIGRRRAPADTTSLDHLQARFEHILSERGLFSALQFLNSTTSYRFTGVYRFEPGLVRNVALVDRDNPDLHVGEDVPWFDSYCMMAAGDARECEIQDSLADARLTGHAARERVKSYCAVLLRTPNGEELGTLCHYDVCPTKTPPGIFDQLRACRAPLERHLWEHMRIRREALPSN